LRDLISAVALAAASFTASAHGFQLGSIEIGHPNARPTGPGQSVGAGYFKLVNKGPADRLLSIATPAASMVELHSMSMDGNVMKMRQIDAIELPAGQTVEFKSGGLHPMLLGLKAPLKDGDRLPMTLKFEKAGSIEVTVNVEKPEAMHACDHKH
jgi:copper(I)-binding protein